MSVVPGVTVVGIPVTVVGIPVTDVGIGATVVLRTNPGPRP
jgi:hypothetical protein